MCDESNERDKENLCRFHNHANGSVPSNLHYGFVDSVVPGEKFILHASAVV